MPAPRPLGRVITFYSYKGGTGRSMALSNIAWILAGNGKRVLMIDWDLEAPGLHRYFKPFLIDHELSASDGLIDLIDTYANEAIKPPPEGDSQRNTQGGAQAEAQGGMPAADWWWPYTDFSDHILSINFAHFPAGGKIDLLPAGRQSESYAVRVSAFNWQNFYDRLGGGGFLDAVRKRAQQDYDYILIDSRTGVSDTAGICTAQMPETLVVCFTYNNQSIKGAAAVAASARRMQADLATQRLQQAAQPHADGSLADTPRPYLVYPVPMRVDAGESDRLALRQAFARDAFQPLLDHLGTSEQPEYWSAVEVPHRVFYAYEEVLAPFKDDAYDPKTVLSAFVRLTRYISGGEVQDFRMPLEPQVRQQYLDTFAETPQTAAARRAAAESSRETAEQTLLRKADSAWNALAESEHAQARSVLCRLVRIVRAEEGGGSHPIRVAMSEFDPVQRAMVATLAQRGLLAISTEVRTAVGGTSGAEQVVGFSDDKLPALWPRLQGWLNEDRDFLLWRQQLRGYRTDWARTGEQTVLISGSLLGEARLWSRKRTDDLNNAEREFIDAAMFAAQPRPAAEDQTLPPATSFGDITLPLRPAAAASAAPPPAAPMASAAPPLAAPPVRSRAPLWIGVALVPVLAAAVWWLWGPRQGAVPVAIPPILASAPPIPGNTVAGPDIAALLVDADRLYAAGRLADAAAAYRKVLDADASNVQALLQLGRVLDRSGDYAGSSAAYDRAIALQPKNAQPLIERAASRISQRQFNEAVADLNQALTLDDHNALAYFNRGAAYENLGRSKEAINDYSAAIQWQNTMVPAYLRRATLLEKTNRQAAGADYQSVLRLPADAAAVQTAQERLKALGTPDVQAVAPPGQRVLLQYSDRDDQARAEALRKILIGVLAPASVPGSEYVSARSSGDVRYFYESDRAFAESVGKATEQALAKQGKTIPLKVIYRDAKGLTRARQGTVEIWLPSLSLVAPARAEIRPSMEAAKK